MRRLFLTAAAMLLSAPLSANPVFAARDRTPPKLVDAVVVGSTVTLRYSEPIAAPLPSASRWIVSIGTARATPTGVWASGRIVVATIAVPAWSDDTVSVTTPPGVRDRAGNRAPGTERAVANASPAGCAPTLQPTTAFGEGNAVRVTSLASTGTLRAAMLFVDFDDAVATEPPAEAAAALAPGASFLESESRGRLHVTISPLLRWLRVPGSSKTYAQLPGALAEAAIAAADPAVDFSKVDFVYVVEAKGAAITASYTMTPATRNLSARADGVTVANAVTLAPQLLSDGSRRWPILAHETGHLLGLPDLYDTTLSRFPLGWWDPMSAPRGASFFAWHLWKLGWLDPTELRCARTGTTETDLTPASAGSGVRAVVALLDDSRALVVEARRRLGYDTALCGEGVLVWTVDASAKTLPATLHHPGAVSPDACDEPVTVGESVSVGGVKVDVLAATASGWRVRVSR